MIDTVKISVPYQEKPKWFDKAQKATNYNANSGVFTATVYPSKSYKRERVYLPKLQYVERPATALRERSFALNIELSLPKLYYGNNFNELTDELFSAVVNKLSQLLHKVYDISISPSEIEQAPLSRVDYSKNIIFTDRTPVSTIIDTIEKADVSKTYDLQRTNFKNGGQIYHIHTNTIDVVMYDKVADLRQAKVSDKRAWEDENYSQLDLLDEFDKHKNVTIPRWEIRLNGKRTILKELRAIGASDDLSFSYLFSTDISRKVLLLHWQNIFDRIEITETVANTATQILVSYKQAEPSMKFAQASALTLMQLIRKETRGERAVRNIIEGLFGTPQYDRLKKMTRDPPSQTRLKDLLYITETLTSMNPVSIADFNP
jgi:hypothetical protein